MKRESLKSTIEQLTKEEKIYVVYEEGWFFTDMKAAFKSRKEALNFLNETEESLAKKTKSYFNYHTERDTYFTIEEKTLSDLIDKYISDELAQKIGEQKQEIIKQGNQEIYHKGYKDGRNAMKDLLQQIYHLISRYVT